MLGVLEVVIESCCVWVLKNVGSGLGVWWLLSIVGWVVSGVVFRFFWMLIWFLDFEGC